MSDHYTDGFDVRPGEDGWHQARCVCGWNGGPYPDAETTADALMDHAYSAALVTSPGARHDVPDLEDIAGRVEALIDERGGLCIADDPDICGRHAELLFDGYCEDDPADLRAVLAILRPPVLVPRDEPTREDIEG